MPLQKCSENGKSGGYRWGSKGKCYFGPDAKKQALKQGYAISPEEFSAKASFDDDIPDEVIVSLYNDTDVSNDDFIAIAASVGYPPKFLQQALLKRAVALASKTKSYEVKYEVDGHTSTTSVNAKTSSDATRYVRNEHPTAKIIDVYEI